MEYEVLVWTKFAQAVPYRPVKEVDGEINSPELAKRYAETLMKLLEDFKPIRYEIIERKSIFTKELEPK